ARHFPRGDEAAEMIEAHAIDECQYRAHPIGPPRVAGLRESRPVVMRIAPQLTRSAEVVGWYAGNHRWTSGRVETKELAVGPDVGAVVCDEDGQIAQDADRVAVTVSADARPLIEEQELQQLVQSNLARQPCRPRRDRRWPACGDA